MQQQGLGPSKPEASCFMHQRGSALVHLLSAPSCCSDKAQNLRDQLIIWQTPPEPTWPARQQHLNWLDIASANVKEIFSSLRRHWFLLEQQGRVSEAMDLIQVRLTWTRLCFAALVLTALPGVGWAMLCYAMSGCPASKSRVRCCSLLEWLWKGSSCSPAANSLPVSCFAPTS